MNLPSEIPDYFRKRWEAGNLEEGYVAGVLAGLEFYVLVTPRHIRRPGESLETFRGQKDLLVGLSAGRVPLVQLEVKSCAAAFTWETKSLPFDPFSVCSVKEASYTAPYAFVSQVTGAILAHLPGKGERFKGMQPDFVYRISRERMQVHRRDVVTFEELVTWLRIAARKAEGS